MSLKLACNWLSAMDERDALKAMPLEEYVWFVERQLSKQRTPVITLVANSPQKLNEVWQLMHAEPLQTTLDDRDAPYRLFVVSPQNAGLIDCEEVESSLPLLQDFTFQLVLSTSDYANDYWLDIFATSDCLILILDEPMRPSIVEERFLHELVIPAYGNQRLALVRTGMNGVHDGNYAQAPMEPIAHFYADIYGKCLIIEAQEEALRELCRQYTGEQLRLSRENGIAQSVVYANAKSIEVLLHHNEMTDANLRDLELLMQKYKACMNRISRSARHAIINIAAHISVRLYRKQVSAARGQYAALCQDINKKLIGGGGDAAEPMAMQWEVFLKDSWTRFVDIRARKHTGEILLLSTQAKKRLEEDIAQALQDLSVAELTELENIFSSGSVFSCWEHHFSFNLSKQGYIEEEIGKSDASRQSMRVAQRITKGMASSAAPVTLIIGADEMTAALENIFSRRKLSVPVIDETVCMSVRAGARVLNEELLEDVKTLFKEHLLHCSEDVADWLDRMYTIGKERLTFMIAANRQAAAVVCRKLYNLNQQILILEAFAQQNQIIAFEKQLL